jgi:hypothetical protein
MKVHLKRTTRIRFSDIHVGFWEAVALVQWRVGKLSALLSFGGLVLTLAQLSFILASKSSILRGRSCWKGVLKVLLSVQRFKSTIGGCRTVNLCLVGDWKSILVGGKLYTSSLVILEVSHIGIVEPSNNSYKAGHYRAG